MASLTPAVTVVDAVCASYDRDRQNLIPILQDVQDRLGFLSEEAIYRISEFLGLSENESCGVATFYTQFRFVPPGKHCVRVCQGTACHVRGSGLIREGISRKLGIIPGETTPDLQFSLERVACLGSCALAPAVVIDDKVYGRMTPRKMEKRIEEIASSVTNLQPDLQPNGASPQISSGHQSGSRVDQRTRVVDFAGLQKRAAAAWKEFTREDGLRVLIGSATCGRATGSLDVLAAFQKELQQHGLSETVRLAEIGCNGLCFAEVLVEVKGPDGRQVLYQGVEPGMVPELVESHLVKGEPVRRYALALMQGKPLNGLARFDDLPAIKPQRRVVLRNCGVIDPLNLDHYVAQGGYSGLTKALSLKPEEVIKEIERSGLRGRGGAGFSTAMKWSFARKASGDSKYVICNADEGDPGAFMNRSVLEGDPHAVLEGLIIAGYAIGAKTGYVYIRAEYPLAVERIHHSLSEMRANGLLGDRILGSDFSFDIKVKKGAGAFVCGEETALMASIEGHRGMPRSKPPFPANSGLFQKPTNINNVETLAAVSVIMEKGGAWYAQFGTEKSRGTKTFSLVGKITRTGLIEVPLGTPLRTIIEDIGGGCLEGKQFKAVQTGGPSGGCIPATLLDTPVDYEHLAEAGSIMGSGGLVVMDEDSCMVDVARYFLSFTENESCGKCVPCRMGTQHLLNLLTDITEGRGRPEQLEQMKQIGDTMKKASLCGLGQTAPNPVLTTLRYFRHEYEAHIREHRCAEGVCGDLFHSPCENTCPLHMDIPGYLQLLNENRLADAFEWVVLDNPLPASTGRVCQHPCEKHCRRASVDAPVNMREVHRYIFDAMLNQASAGELVQRLCQRKLPATRKRVAVVGAGPAGLSAAFYLVLLGHEVTVYEAEAEAGGMLRYSLPEYRLPKVILDSELQLIRGVGVQFQFDQALGRNLALAKLEADHDAVFLALGTWQELDLRVPGETFKGVHHALSFLKAVALGKDAKIGRRVVVVGGGNAAIDAARTALRLGAKVTIAYRRAKEDMPAIPEETEQALEEGAQLICLAAPAQVLGENGKVTGLEVAKTVLGKSDSKGRRTPIITDEKYTIPCDTILLAIGEKAEAGLMKKLGLELDKWGSIHVDPWTLQTSHPKVYAGGDLITGAANVTSAMALGKKAAAAIDKQLSGEDRFRRLWPNTKYDNSIPPDSQGGSRNTGLVVPSEQRRRGFDEISHTFTECQAKAESLRCLRCDVKALNPAIAPAALQSMPEGQA